LFAANTPDGNLEIFDVTPGGLIHVDAVSVGMEPVSVAARSDDEVWVVNQVSDSISIVDVSAQPPRVVRTLIVGDEPRGIVFAGTGNNRAFIATARRGQQYTHPTLAGVPGAGDPKLTTEGEPRASVWVFDTNNLGHALGGTPVSILNLFSDVPRALATSPDGNIVYAAAFASGNQTTVANAAVVCPGFDPWTPCTLKGGAVYPGGNAGPPTNYEGVQAPDVGIIVKYEPGSGHFEDELGRNWDNAIKFDLPDLDVFAIDANTLATISAVSGVGTTLFNMATNPQTGNLYVSNTEAVNEVRFEGPGNYGGSTVQGHLAESRITVVSGSTVSPRHLNKHIDYSITPAPAGTKEHSLATPADMAISSDGTTLYVAAFGSSQVGVYSTAALENDSFDPTVVSADHLDVSGGGPSGLALDEVRNRIYVLTRFDNSVSVVDLGSGIETAHIPMNNPEPTKVVEGRPFLYDAQFSSSNGEASCSSCHIFGDKDELAWDLGDPDAPVATNPGGITNNIRLGLVANIQRPEINGTGQVDLFHSMKGPMTTQTLRGMVNNGAMHWRGDRATGFFGTDPSLFGPPFDSDLAFRNFIVAFEGLNGREDIIEPEEMQKFADFALEITLPPNPVRSLDNSLTAAEARGKKFFMGCDGPDSVTTLDPICINGRPLLDGGHRSDGLPFIPELGFTCEGCHSLEPQNGFFGTDGRWSFEDLPQIVKIPHLRNVYTKIGMYGLPDVPEIKSGDNGHKGDQIRGFGFLHDGSVDTIFRFYRGTVFDCNGEDQATELGLGGLVGFCGGDPQRRDAEEFMLAFDSDLAPIVGQQVTMTKSSRNDSTVNARVNLLESRCRKSYPSKILGAGSKECDLVAKVVVSGSPRTYRLETSGFFAGWYKQDNGWLRSSSYVRDRAKTSNQPVTWTAHPYGSGNRVASDLL
jgi:DNA-binding beta-propeller fold protein YncE